MSGSDKGIVKVIDTIEERLTSLEDAALYERLMNKEWSLLTAGDLEFMASYERQGSEG